METAVILDPLRQFRNAGGHLDTRMRVFFFNQEYLLWQKSINTPIKITRLDQIASNRGDNDEPCLADIEKCSQTVKLGETGDEVSLLAANSRSKQFICRIMRNGAGPSASQAPVPPQSLFGPVQPVPQPLFAPVQPVLPASQPISIPVASSQQDESDISFYLVEFDNGTWKTNDITDYVKSLFPYNHADRDLIYMDFYIYADNIWIARLQQGTRIISVNGRHRSIGDFMLNQGQITNDHQYLLFPKYSYNSRQTIALRLSDLTIYEPNSYQARLEFRNGGLILMNGGFQQDPDPNQGTEEEGMLDEFLPDDDPLNTMSNAVWAIGDQILILHHNEEKREMIHVVYEAEYDDHCSGDMIIKDDYIPVDESIPASFLNKLKSRTYFDTAVPKAFYLYNVKTKQAYKIELPKFLQVPRIKSTDPSGRRLTPFNRLRFISSRDYISTNLNGYTISINVDTKRVFVVKDIARYPLLYDITNDGTILNGNGKLFFSRSTRVDTLRYEQGPEAEARRQVMQNLNLLETKMSSELPLEIKQTIAQYM